MMRLTITLWKDVADDAEGCNYYRQIKLLIAEALDMTMHGSCQQSIDYTTASTDPPSTPPT